MSSRSDQSIARIAFSGVPLTRLVVMSLWETVSLVREWGARRSQIVAGRSRS